jgi:hypothetical protein
MRRPATRCRHFSPALAAMGGSLVKEKAKNAAPSPLLIQSHERKEVTMRKAQMTYQFKGLSLHISQADCLFE